MIAWSMTSAPDVACWARTPSWAMTCSNDDVEKAWKEKALKCFGLDFLESSAATLARDSVLLGPCSMRTSGRRGGMTEQRRALEPRGVTERARGHADKKTYLARTSCGPPVR